MFAVACCRHIWSLLASDLGREWVELAERHADGEVGPSKLKMARRAYQPTQGSLSCGEMALWAAFSTMRPATWCAAFDAAQGAADAVVTASDAGRPWSDQVHADRLAARKLAGSDQAALFGRIFGTPFRPVPTNSLWLTSNVVAVAHPIYDECAFDRLPILADALEESGCTDAGILCIVAVPGPTSAAAGPWISSSESLENRGVDTGRSPKTAAAADRRCR